MMIGKVGLQNNGICVSAINKSASHKNEAITGKKREERLTAIISPAGKRDSMLQQLMKQKQNLTNRMSELTASSLEKGTDIKDKMDEYHKQLDALDEQILKLQMQQEDDKKDSETSGIYEKPKTKEEIEAQRMNNIMNLASGSGQADVIYSAKNRLDGETNVLKSEIKTGYGNIESKLEKVAELESKSTDLIAEIGERLADANNEASDSQNNAEKSDNADEKSATSQNSDIMIESKDEAHVIRGDENTPLSGV